MRIEKDFIGTREIDDNNYYGIHTERAKENFKIPYKRTDMELIKSIAIVKMAAAISNYKTGKLGEKTKNFIVDAADRIIAGEFNDQFVLPGIQGGAGTSSNMNVNEVIANIANESGGMQKGNYNFVHPIEHVNLSQSTNDVFPTAVKITVIKILRELVDEIMELQSALQDKEHEFSDIFKMGRTQLMDAVPLSLGDEFGAYAEAVSRDRWRLYKIEERIRQINIGGTAIGTGVGASTKYRFYVTEELKRLTGFGLARAENLIDNTQNQDVFVEISGILKSLAVNLKKISNDLRLLGSGPETGIGEIILPQLQAGSSIMPGKVNPVVPELVKQIYYKVVGNDLSLTMACADGEFELNAMMPIIADNILENLRLLKAGIKLLTNKTIKEIKADRKKCEEYLKNSWSIATLYIDQIGYEKLTWVIKEAQKTGKHYIEILKENDLISD